MQVTCEKCTAKYNIADDKIKASGTAVRCPKCQHVFKVFGTPQGGDTVACANCGKQTPSVAGQAVVFCGDCQSKLAGDTGGGDAFAGGGDDPFAGGDIFKDSPAPPPPPAPAAPASGGGLFDDAPAGGGGLFDDAPAAPAGGGLFDDAPAAPAGGGLFDDEPAAPAGGGLFDDAPAAPAGGGLFDDAPASSGGGLFDEPANMGGGAAADPFAEFESAPATGGSSADPFAEFGDQPDDMGFADPDEKPRGPLMPETPAASLEEEEPAPAPVREKTQPTFKKTESTPKERAAEFFAEYGAKIGLYGGIAVGALVVGLTAALVLLPATFGARPSRIDDQPGLLARSSFSLQKTFKTKFYGQAMEDAYIQAGAKAMTSWSGVGFAAAEKEYKELLAFDAANQAAKAGLLNLYATWDLVEEKTDHQKEIMANLKSPKVTAEASVRALLAIGQAREAAQAAAQLGDRGAFYAAFARLRAGAELAPASAAATAAATVTAPATTAAAAITPAAAPVTASVAARPASSLDVLGAYAKANAKDYLAQVLYASALRDAQQYAAAVSAYEAAMRAVPADAKANLEIGKLYYGPLNEGDKAITHLNAALDTKAGGTDLLKAEARYYLSHILQKRGRGPQALDAITAALAVDGANPRYLTMNGDLLFDSGKVVDAFTSYEKAAKSDPKYVDAYIGIGRANEKLDKSDTALENYRKAIELDPVNMRANFLYAALILKQGRKEEAEKVFTAVLDRDPTNIEAIAQLARFYEDQERLGDALKEYAHIIELAPGKIDGFVGRGAVLLRQNDISDAKAMFTKAAALEPENPNVLFRLGQAAHLEGDHQTAEASLSKALGRDPYHWEAHLYLGMAYAAQAKYDQALVEYQKTIDVNQKAGEAFRQRGLVYLAQSKLSGADAKAAAGLVQKAVAELERALYYSPSNPDYYFDYGNCLDAAGLAGKARDAWLKAKELRPGFKEAMFALASYYVSFTDYGSAEAMLKDVLKNSPKNAQAYLGMGKVYVAKGNLDEAYRAFSRAAQLDAKNAEAQNLIGEVYDRQGLTNQAFTYYQRALRLNGKHAMAHFNLGLYWKDRDKEKAKREFKGALDSGALSREKHEEAQELLKELEYVK